MIEQVKRLEIELRAAKEAGFVFVCAFLCVYCHVKNGLYILGGKSEKSTGDELSATSADAQMNDLLKEELEHIKHKKKETEEQLMNSKRENVELKSQLNSISKELYEIKENRASHDASIATTKDLETQVC